MAKEKFVTQDEIKAEEAENVVPAEETNEEVEVQEESQEATEEVQKSDDGLKDVEGETPRERALRLEITKLKAERRQARSLDLVKGEDDEEPATVTKAEAVLLNAFQQEAFDEFIEKYPQYSSNDDAWDKFMGEFNDRKNIVDFAKSKNTPITKKLIRERLESVHRSVGLDMSSAMEDGKREVLKAQAAARIAGTGMGSGEVANKGEQPVKRSLFKKTDNSLNSWLTKKK